MWHHAGPDTPRRPVPSNPGPGDVPPQNPSPDEPNPADPKPYPTRPVPDQPEIEYPPWGRRGSGAVRGAWLLAAALALPACGDPQTGGTTTSINAEERGTIQKASAPVMTAELATQAAGDAVVESGGPGLASAVFPAILGFNFQGSINRPVDLGVTGSGGIPRYPGAAGHLSVLASGVAAGGGGSGSVNYLVTVTATSDLTFTDPESGDVATIAPGTRWSTTLRIDWAFTDVNNWSVTAQSSAAVGPLSVQIVHLSETISAELSGTRQKTARYDKSSGLFVRSGSVTADWSEVWTDGGGTHSVGFRVSNLDAVTITADGAVYGPLSREELRILLRLHWE